MTIRKTQAWSRIIRDTEGLSTKTETKRLIA